MAAYILSVNTESLLASVSNGQSKTSLCLDIFENFIYTWLDSDTDAGGMLLTNCVLDSSIQAD